jgi:hypothetical protein
MLLLRLGFCENSYKIQWRLTSVGDREERAEDSQFIADTVGLNASVPFLNKITSDKHVCLISHVNLHITLPPSSKAI